MLASFSTVRTGRRSPLHHHHHLLHVLLLVFLHCAAAGPSASASPSIGTSPKSLKPPKLALELDGACDKMR